MRRNGKVEKNMHKGGSRSKEKNTKVCVLYRSVQKVGTRILRHRVTVHMLEYMHFMYKNYFRPFRYKVEMIVQQL